MGFFSWKTQDTGKSIPNRYSGKKTFPVVLHDNRGNKWAESNYEGYGVFGGKDFYELLAEMNGKTTRKEGIDIAFSDNTENVLFPNITRYPGWEWRNEQPEDCEYQGYFYGT